MYFSQNIFLFQYFNISIFRHEKSFKCDICSHTFGRKEHLKQHIKTHENPKVKASKEENKDPIQPPPLKRPKILHVYECKVCGMEFGQVKDLQDHATTHQKEEKKEIPDDIHMEGALNNALKVVTFEVEGTQKVDLLQLFSGRRDDIATFVMEEA